MFTLNDLRQTFIKFFESKGHTIVPSSTVIPQDDKTLLFVNAGMNQFKDVFIGKEVRPYTRACSSQKCIRAGGKHNDLENVGYTNRHHTFFEMLGNFSFGDYFKEDAIKFAWEFISSVLKLPVEKLCITVYHTDDEAYNIWKSLVVPAGMKEENIIRISTKDNFWEMGEVGPCGPCSEIFYDYGSEYFGDKPGTPDEDGDRWVEIWNLVFMQYEKYYDENGDVQIRDLPKPCVDTGAGLERLSSVLQGKHSNYDTDLMTNLKNGISKIIDVKITEKNRALFNIIADHIRAVSFSIVDGASFSNEGQGYVIRKIIRRALGALNRLGVDKPVFYKFNSLLVKEMGGAYPELKSKEKYVESAIKVEEKLFLKTLGSGMKMLDKEVAALAGAKVMAGDVVFKLYDTYGMPSDIVRDVLKDSGLDFDEYGFAKAMADQKQKSRGARKSATGTLTEKIWYDLKAEFGNTIFEGYNNTSVKAAKVIYLDDNKVVFDRTPFYAESGGQVSDTGKINYGRVYLDVYDVQKMVGGIYVHYYKPCEICMRNEGVDYVGSHPMSVGGEVDLFVDEQKRKRITAHHTGCHLLQAALREVLGEHIVQRGSKVEQFKLHFDFSHGKALSSEEKSRVEDLINGWIDDDLPVFVEEMSIEDARKTGAVAPFDEKYGDRVRVVSIGGVDHSAGVSCEFCGGTHVSMTGDIACLSFERDESIAAGVRRISMVRHSSVMPGHALEFVRNARLEAVKLQEEEVARQLAEKEAKKQEEEKNKAGDVDVVVNSVKPEKVAGISFVSEELVGISPKNLKFIADALMKKAEGKKTVILLVNENDGRVSVVAAVSPDLTTKISAVDIVSTVSRILGGRGGGGRPDMAQGGAESMENIDKAFSSIKNLL